MLYAEEDLFSPLPLRYILMIVKNRRLHFRIPIRISVVISGHDRIIARTRNLSVGGISLEPVENNKAKKFNVGEGVSLAFNLSGSSLPLVISGTITHIDDSNVGVAFDDVCRKDIELIEQSVWESLAQRFDVKQDCVLPFEVPIPLFRMPLDVPVSIIRDKGIEKARAMGITVGGIVIHGIELFLDEQVIIELSLKGSEKPLTIPGIVVKREEETTGLRFINGIHHERKKIEEAFWQHMYTLVFSSSKRYLYLPEEKELQKLLKEIDEIYIQRDKNPARKESTKRDKSSRKNARRTCEVPGCKKPHKAKGLCSKHYNQARRNKK